MKELVKYGSSNYWTEFECKSLDNKGGSNEKMSKQVCFHGFSRYKGKQEFWLRIWKGMKKTEEGYNHLCLSGLGEIVEHIEALDLVLRPGEFTLHEIEDGEEYYTVHFTIDSEYNTVYGYCLTWIRYLYERPYVFALWESMKMKEIFPEMDPFARFNIARASMPPGSYWGTGHSAISVPGRLLKLDAIKEKIHKDSDKQYSALNSLYPAPTSNLTDKLQKQPRVIGNFGSGDDLEYWRGEKEFKSIIEIYKQNLKVYEEENT